MEKFLFSSSRDWVPPRTNHRKILARPWTSYPSLQFSADIAGRHCSTAQLMNSWLRIITAVSNLFFLEFIQAADIMLSLSYIT